MKTAILGGGLAGLTIGNHLKSDFIIFEQNNECGGLCRSLKEGGFTFDCGGAHIIFSKNKNTVDYILSLLKNNISVCKRNTKIFYKGNHVKYPFENGLRDLPIEENFECLYTFIDNLIKKEKNEIPKPTNFKEWMYYTFGKGITEKYLLPFNKKIWNHDLKDMGIEWVEGRIPNPPVEDVIKSSLGIGTEGYSHQLHFYYPTNGGIQSLIDGLEKPIKSKIIKNVSVTGMGRKNNGWVIHIGEKEYHFDKVVSTIPLMELMKIVDVPKSVSRAISSLKYNSLIVIMIGIDVPKMNDISWMYFPDENKTGFHKVSFPSNFSKEVTPEGKSSLMVEMTYNEGDAISYKSDEEIINDVIYDLENYDIIKGGTVCFTKVYRTKYAYIVHDKNYSGNVRKIYDYFNKIGIELCGRFSEFKYLNMDTVIENSIKTATMINKKIK